MADAGPLVLYVLSSNYAGSHLLSLVIGSHPRAMHLGELRRLWPRRDDAPPFCVVCPDDSVCPVVQAGSDRSPGGIYRALAERFPSTSLFVDASKRLDWIRFHEGGSGFEERYLHLLRDPRAHVRRWKLDGRCRRLLARERFRLLRRHPGRWLRWRKAPHLLLAQKWLRQNMEFTEFLATRPAGTVRVITYHDLLTAPHIVLTSLMGWLGLRYHPSQLNYWTEMHHGTQKARYKDGGFGFGKLDLRWHSDLPADQAKEVIKACSVAKYLRSLGLASTEQGLVDPRLLVRQAQKPDRPL